MRQNYCLPKEEEYDTRNDNTAVSPKRWQENGIEEKNLKPKSNRPQLGHTKNAAKQEGYVSFNIEKSFSDTE